MSDSVWQSASVAARYLEGVRAAIPFAAEQIEIMLRLLKSCRRPVHRFLDLGCGDGVLAAAILDHWPAATAVLVDFSPPMLKAARQRLGDRVQIVCSDYSETHWRSTLGRFDAIVSGFSIHHQPDARKRSLYTELYDMLEPGAMFINIEHVLSASRWVEALADDFFIDSLHNASPEKTREEVAAWFHSRPDKTANILAPVETQCEWLRLAGFHDVDCYFKAFELAVFGGRK